MKNDKKIKSLFKFYLILILRVFLSSCLRVYFFKCKRIFSEHEDRKTWRHEVNLLD